MTTNRLKRSTSAAASAFTLIELLTVVFIIGLLIAILVPSIGAARRSAKTASSKATISSISTALEMFKNENEQDYPRTNGYPPSFAHPVLMDDNDAVVFSATDSAQGRFPFIQSKPHVYGAHWLPMMLMGLDLNGYIEPESVPPEQKGTPWTWYRPDANGQLIERQTLYMDPSKAKLTTTENLPGAPPTGGLLSNGFPDWDDMKQLPVFVDSFDNAILYYASNRGASPRNLVEDEHKDTNDYTDEGGPPFYFHQDNRGFTGFSPNLNGSGGFEGWRFSGGNGHKLRIAGHLLNGGNIEQNPDTFAGYVYDRAAFEAQRNSPLPKDKLPLRARNADSYLLISTGADSLYGTADDVSNLASQAK